MFRMMTGRPHRTERSVGGPVEHCGYGIGHRTCCKTRGFEALWSQHRVGIDGNQALARRVVTQMLQIFCTVCRLQRSIGQRRCFTQQQIICQTRCTQIAADGSQAVGSLRVPGLHLVRQAVRMTEIEN